MSAESRVAELGLELPPASPPAGLYRPIVVHGNLAYLSGHGPQQADGRYMVGKVGSDVDVQGGRLAARQAGLAMLQTLRSELGTLDRVRRVVKVLGMVNATAQFGRHPAVIDGFSQLMVEVFGEERGVGARSAVGMGSLPGNITVEVEAVFEIATVDSGGP